VTPAAVTQQAYGIDQAGRHLWWPIAPAARVELSCRHPDLSWSGHGYLDHNRGDEPLEAGFVEWDWSRAPLSEGAAVLYDVTCKDGTQGSLALRFDRTGTAHAVAPPAPAPLPRTLWRVNRHTRADAGTTPRVRTTLEDAPFYARSLVDTRLLGEDVTAVHESLSLTRFSRSWVRLLLPFRMPRRPG
jgi:carotenoid 1,2-hydratase